MELDQEINVNLLKENNQNEFLESTLWKTINNGIDIGIRYLLPDLVEDEIIELKDNLINFGLKDGIKESIDSVIETGKEAIGILSGNFENVTQIQKAIKNGGIIDKVSDSIDARYIENIHNLIKNNGENFNLSEETLELAEKLCV